MYPKLQFAKIQWNVHLKSNHNLSNNSDHLIYPLLELFIKNHVQDLQQTSVFAPTKTAISDICWCTLFKQLNSNIS